MFWPDSVHPGHSYQYHDQRIIFEVHVSQGRGVGVKEMFLQTKSIIESSLTFSNLLDVLRTEVIKTEV